MRSLEARLQVLESRAGLQRPHQDWINALAVDVTQQAAAQIWVDPINGNDNATGNTQSAAVRTTRQVARRLAAYDITVPSLDVRYTSYPPDNDPFRVDIAIQTSVGQIGPVLNFYGPPLVMVSSGTFSNVISRNRGLNTPWEVQDNIVVTTGDIASRIRIPSGPRAGATTWVSKAPGPGRRRTGEWGTWDVVNGGTRVTPQAGDLYVIEQAPGVGHFDYVRVTAGDSNVYPSQSLVTFHDWDFTTGSMGGVGWAENRNTQLTFMNCRFRHFDNLKILTPVASPTTFSYIENCCCDNTVGEIRFVQGGINQNYVDGGVFVNALLAEGGGCAIDFDTLMDGSSSLGGGGTIAAIGGQSMVQILSAGIMDSGPGGSGQGAIVSRDGGIIVASPSFGFYGSQAWIWGVSAFLNSVGARIDDGGRMRVRVPANITVTGDAGDFKMCGSSTSYPWDPVTRTHTAPVNNTWGNLAAKGMLEDPLHDVKLYVSSGVSLPA